MNLMDKRWIRIFRLVFLILIVTYFFIQIYHVVFTVGDDLKTYINVSKGIWGNVAINGAFTGRITHLYNTILLGIPMLANNLLVYKLFSYGSILFDIFVFYKLIKKYADKDTAYLVVLLFFAMATITNKHNLFISYIFCHQILIGLIVLSVYLFLKYYETNGKRYLLISAVLYIVSVAVYEGMMPFIILFIMLAFLGVKDNKKRILSLGFHMIFLILWVVFYFMWQRFYPTHYDGGKFYFGDPLGSLFAVVLYSLGCFPLCSFFGAIVTVELDRIWSQHHLFDFITMWGVVSSALAAFIFARVLPCISWTKSKKYMLILSAISMFIPNIILSFTYKYIEWARRLVYAYLTSFYCWFFMVLVFVLSSVCVYEYVKAKKMSLVILSSAVFIGTICASVSNEIWFLEFNNRSEIQSAFDDAISAQAFLEEEDGTYVYMPDRRISTYSLDDLTEYTKIYTDKEFIFVNKLEDADFSGNVIEMSYDEGSKEYQMLKLDSGL